MRRRKEQYVFKTPGRERKPRRFLLAFAAFAVLVCGVVLLLSFITNHQVRVETVKLTAQNLHPDMENAQEAVKQMTDAGLKGVKLHPDMQLHAGRRPGL